MKRGALALLIVGTVLAVYSKLLIDVDDLGAMQQSLANETADLKAFAEAGLAAVAKLEAVARKKAPDLDGFEKWLRVGIAI